MFILVLFAVFVPPILELFGEPVRGGLKLQTLGRWAVASGLRVAFVVVLASVLSKIVGISTARFQQALVDSHYPPIGRTAKAREYRGAAWSRTSRARSSSRPRP